MEFFRSTGPIAMAHRGFTSFRLPKNSMAAFHEAVKLGFRYLETDVRATRDGVAVILHDRRLPLASGVSGAIDQLSWRQASAADLGSGEPIPTLEELLVTFPDARVNIDIKAESAIEPTVEVIERLKVHDRVLIASFSDRRRQRAVRLLTQRVASAAGTGAFMAFMAARSAGRRAYAQRMLRDSDCVQLPPRLGGVPVITPALLRAMHASGRQVHAWTIDDPAAMHALLDIGVDGIITDRADLLREVLTSRGQW
ncbi:glycerophosphoryl diester phosphodiesterase family protein [Mycobacterium kansasii 732]|uniref:Glycerophosphodiester phosphodiesterase n=1 Tax=Mycobacterium pseudokansasii TaxID=2341080 RepID=A0A498QJM0_9MYCO|nr:glycerophosphodiester phosphodiesterase [Mycobacterium pseudokansasii]EUA14616.1 glycerophosphoryl diester phosphodiesterase family protein [Mycobacterium kansasii 732]VAZ88234.1 Glycerophosphodiester phosphodiesterase [Mycobacterium pseudokansasii]VAZ88777.1 Glycerophosphodiester phosphodiesterase [Mycobacterium pseudokansasii]VBA46502.1 Glycerophosphodiester phosphodiesterase [Mycobacterium pseudokansasii]